jgi:hypothetical protein
MIDNLNNNSNNNNNNNNNLDTKNLNNNTDEAHDLTFLPATPEEATAGDKA